MKFRKKPVVVEAEQFHQNQEPWPEGVEANPKNNPMLSGVAFVHTLEDWYEMCRQTARRVLGREENTDA